VLDGKVQAGLLRLWHPFAVIELAEPAPNPLPNSALLQYISSEGVLRHRGGLTLGAPELTRFITFRPSGTPQLLLARQRLQAELEVPVSLALEDGTVVETESSSLSTTGLQFAHRTPVQLDERVDLKISLDVFAPAIAVAAEIVAISETGLASAHFIEISPTSRERLEWRIFQHFVTGLRASRS
jgi:hypothetical protein